MEGDQKIGRRPVILAAGPTQEQTPDQRAKLTADHREGGGQLGAAFTWKAPPRTPRSGRSPHPFPRQSFTVPLGPREMASLAGFLFLRRRLITLGSNLDA